jgi:flagellar motor switch protein FliG
MVAPPAARPRIQIHFDDLVRLDSRALAAVLRDVDASVLVLALVGSSDELVDRIAGQMPKRTARAFRRQLRKLGPTRLSDVEEAQQVVARAAARLIGRHAPLAV